VPHHPRGVAAVPPDLAVPAPLFLRFTGKTKEVRKWVADFTNRFVTSAFRQAQEIKEYKLNRISGRAFGGIYITAEGYRTLGLALDGFDEPQGAGSPNTFFRDGMEKGRAELNDPPVNKWDEGFRGRRIHVMVLLADEDQARLEDVRKRVEKSFRGIAEVRAREDGVALRDGNNKPVEQFGYRDGISQPLYFKADLQEEKDKFGIDQADDGDQHRHRLRLALQPEDWGSGRAACLLIRRAGRSCRVPPARAFSY
jgi:deferrochelatase/peroxidase EfeB